MVAAAAGAVTASAVVAGGDGRGKSVLPLRRPISELAEVSSVVCSVAVDVHFSSLIWRCAII